jgi:hypothetical protein
MQTNVVEQKLTVPVAISRIYKYKNEHGNVAVPNREPHKQLRRWIVHAKATSKKIIAQGSGNPKFTLPNLKLLHQLGIIQLPPDFKLLERTTTTISATKKVKKKMTKEPPKAEKRQGARGALPIVSVPVPQKNTTSPRIQTKSPIQPKIKLKLSSKKMRSAPRATANASIEPKKMLQTPSKSTHVSSPPTRTSPRLAATASNISREQGITPFSVLNNPFSKMESTPAYPSEFPSPQTRSTYDRNRELTYPQTTANPHPSPETVNRMESVHPNSFCRSPPMPAASPTSHIPLELPFESVGLRTRQRSHASSEIAMEPQTIAAIGDLSTGIKCKRVAPPLKANKGATKKAATTRGDNKKGAKYVVIKK